ncbi:MAG: ABC transporter ATP-binding protein [Burkholderiales bacterium]|nr:ABC transporter ATP-binding protein [Burkholderiales bacterium]
MNTSVLRAENLGVVVNGKALLRDVNLAVGAGEILALLGANGAGKSTLIAAIAGEVAEHTGRIDFNGVPMVSYSLEAIAVRRALNAAEPALPFAMSVEDYVALGRPFDAPDATAINDALEACHAVEWSERDFATLSSGEQMRVQLARSLYQLGEAPNALWLLDEPCAHLDLAQRRFVLTLLASVAKSRGWAIVFSTHDPAEALATSHKALLLRAGECVGYGATAETITEASLAACYGVAVTRASAFVATK